MNSESYDAFIARKLDETREARKFLRATSSDEPQYRERLNYLIALWSKQYYEQLAKSLPE